MKVIVIVKERHAGTRRVFGHDLTGEYEIDVPGDRDHEAATTAAIDVVREHLSIEDDRWYDLAARVQS